MKYITITIIYYTRTNIALNNIIFKAYNNVNNRKCFRLTI